MIQYLPPQWSWMSEAGDMWLLRDRGFGVRRARRAEVHPATLTRERRDLNKRSRGSAFDKATRGLQGRISRISLETTCCRQQHVTMKNRAI